MNATERYKILSNIVAQKGTRDVNLHAELAKAENTVNMLNTQKSMAPVAPPPVETQTPPPTEQAPQELQSGKYDNL